MLRALVPSQAGGLSHTSSHRDGGTGTFTGAVHLPLVVLEPLRRPEASRWVLELPLALVVPAKRPDASRYCVVALVGLPLLRVVALPANRPLASR